MPALLVRLGRGKAQALARVHVQHDGPLAAAQVRECALERLLVVAVLDVGVVQAECAEGVVGRVAARLAQVRERVVQAALVLRDGPLVVVHDDDEPRTEARDVIETLEGEDGHDVITLAGEVAGAREARREAHGRGRVAHGEVVVLALDGAREARERAHARGVEVVPRAAREHLVGIGLMRDVEDELVDRRAEHAVERHRELNDAEVGAHVAAHLGRACDDGVANLGAQGRHDGGGQRPHVCRRLDVLEVHARSLSVSPD